MSRHTDLTQKTRAVECSRCGEIFNADRSTQKEWFDSKRCSKCGKNHSPTEIKNRIIRPEAEPMSDDKKLYLMRAKDSIKVGTSNSPTRRRGELQTAHAEKIHLVKTWDVKNAQKAEKAIHSRLFDRHQRREWFSVSETNVSSISDAIDLFLESYDSG